MKSRIITIMSILLLALGAVACDDTLDGIQEDADSIEQGIEDGVDEATDE